ncbi:hypothetical protein MPSEU_001092100 [Mayamaea pseudoterrestris]|nr:hypothetical protein MPSEU_000287300 [Mayamaea pseudoterrestris]GKZ01413.1 hypothetical protein MPSEU_001092100 [Mayamaea pseudoterrestris]
MINSSIAATREGSNRHEEFAPTSANGSDGAEIHSLGEALAGVTLGNSATASFGSSHDPIARADSGTGWGNFTATDSGNGAFSNLSSSNQQNDDLALFLSQDPSKTLGESVLKLSNSNLVDLHYKDQQQQQHHHHHLETNMTKSESQSSFRMHTGSGSDLRETLGPVVKANSFADGVSRGRTRDSSVCSATGTTASSRSVSPFASSSQGGYTHSSDHYSRASQGYGNQRYGTPPMTGSVFTDVLGRSVQSPHHTQEDERSSSGYSMSKRAGSHPSLATVDSHQTHHQSPYSISKEQQRQQQRFSSGGSSPFETPSHHGGSASFASENNDSSSPTLPIAQHTQPQVLYMAVPSPDGRGQVLQPVQMMQLPGKPYHFVSNTSLPATQQQQLLQVVPQLMTGTASVDSSNHGNANSMMVLPPLEDVSLQAPTLPTTNYQASPLVATNRPRLASYGSDSGPLTTAHNTSHSHQFTLDVAPAPLTQPDNARSSASVNSRTSSPFTTNDPALALLYASPQRPQLDALLGQVRRLSRDQVGCRLVQQALDEEGPLAATMIMNEGLAFWGEAMIDPFGNYLFQKVLEKVTAEERITLIKSVSPRLVNASLNLHGTRSVQKVVELCALDEQSRPVEADGESAADILATALGPAAARLCIDSHGNHVIQRILLKFGPKHTRFVFDAVAANVGDVARHRHGCCVIQRCLDSPSGEARSMLILRIVEFSLELMQDAYGNYVVQYVLDVCPDEDVHAVCESVVGKVNVLAVQKFSSNVMEKCLERCSDRVREQYLHEMSDPERIREMMMDPFGNYVVQRALAVATHAQAIRLVEAMRPHLTATQTIGPQGQRNGGVRNTAGGRRIIAKICRRFPHFTLSEDGISEPLNQLKAHGHRHHIQHQQQPYHHHMHQQPMQYQHQPHVMVSPYSSIGPPPPSLQQPFYSHDPRMNSPPGFMNMALPPVQQQQQHQVQAQQQLMPSFYNMGDGSNLYFDQQQQFGGGYRDM